MPNDLNRKWDIQKQYFKIKLTLAKWGIAKKKGTTPNYFRVSCEFLKMIYLNYTQSWGNVVRKVVQGPERWLRS